jgi:hypothetical protein
VARLLNGIERAQAQRAQERPIGADTQPLLYTTLQKLRFDTSSHRDLMIRAAAFLGIAAGLRPGELLGSTHTPERALLREQLRFYADRAATIPMPSAGAGGVPAVMEVVLRLTKTSQLRQVVKLVTAADAIAAVWEWLAAARRGPRDLIFQLRAGERRLTTFALTKDLERRHRKAGLGRAHFTGKSWRMGGASTLAIQGLDPADIAALGWAPDSSMWERYARDPAVQRQRAVARGDLMDPRRVPAERPPIAARRLSAGGLRALRARQA